MSSLSLPNVTVISVLDSKCCVSDSAGSTFPKLMQKCLEIKSEKENQSGESGIFLVLKSFLGILFLNNTEFGSEEL